MQWKSALVVAPVLFSALCICAAPGALAQAWPSRPIRMVVPFPPGAADIPARLIAPKMQAELGQPVFIDNRAGANGIIGSDAVAKSPPDGYTVLFTASSTIIANQYLFKTIPYTPADFTPVSIVLDTPNLLMAHPSTPFNSLKELVEQAKRSPGKFTYASSSIGSAAHMEGEGFKTAAGLDIVHVPYKGFGAAIPELLAGRVDLMPVPYFVVKAMIASGKLKPIAVSDSARYAKLPQLPALSEVAPGFHRAPAWLGVLGPAKLPRPVVGRLNAAIVKAVNAPDVRARFNDDGMIVFGNTPEQFAEVMRQDIAFVSKMVKTLGIHPE
jgi:tripartite-type tricarboxylate transporter receptor subunit TctC